MLKSLGRFAAVLAIALIVRSGPLHAAETVIYKFTGGADGALPNYHLLIQYSPSTQSYSLYGSTSAGGIRCGSEKPAGCGTIFALGFTPSGKLPTIHTTFYTFKGGTDGQEPLNGMAFNTDQTILFGAAQLASNSAATILYKIEPARTVSGYKKTVISQLTDLPRPFPPYSIPDYFQLYFEPTSGVFFGVRRYSGLNQCAPAAGCGEIVMVK